MKGHGRTLKTSNRAALSWAQGRTVAFNATKVQPITHTHWCQSSEWAGWLSSRSRNQIQDCSDVISSLKTRKRPIAAPCLWFPCLSTTWPSVIWYPEGSLQRPTPLFNVCPLPSAANAFQMPDVSFNQLRSKHDLQTLLTGNVYSCLCSLPPSVLFDSSCLFVSVVWDRPGCWIVTHGHVHIQVAGRQAERHRSGHAAQWMPC